jgi:phospholipid/cholesterol/gamma-HCH transport system substrate-binding protein
VSKELKIGIIALVAGFLLYYGFNYLKGTDIFSNTNRFYVQYTHIEGLAVGSTIKMQGVQVGRVSNITFQQAQGNILVELNIQRTISLGDSTIAELTSDGLLGGKAIVLLDKTHRDKLEPGSMLIGQIDKGLSELLASAQPITDNLTITIRRINEILLGMEGSGEVIKQTLVDLDIMIREVNSIMKQNRAAINFTLESSAVTMKRVGDRVDQMGPILENMRVLSDSLKSTDFKATVQSTNDLLQNINSTLDSLKNANGTIGRLMMDDQLYENLNKTIVDLDKLIIHFNTYPKDFMAPLGRKPKKMEGGKE